MKEDHYLTTSELGKLLGISRIAVFRKIKNGSIKAEKVGRTYVISRRDLPDFLDLDLSEKKRETLNYVLDKTMDEYGETLKLLGKE